MPKHILAIAHSAGDTDAIIATANILKERGMKTTILVIGTTARDLVLKKLASEETDISIWDIDSVFEETPDKPISNNLLVLAKRPLDTLCQSIKEKDFDGLFLGTPSFVNPTQQCTIGAQILEKLAPHLPSLVYSDYAYYEPQHSLSQSRWFEKAAKFLVPFPKAIRALGAEPEKSVVVGHPAFDVTKRKYQEWLEQPEETTKIQEKLKAIGIEPEQAFVFAAGGKADDESLIEALAQACKEVPHLKILVGLHPGATAEYVETLQTMIEDHRLSTQMTIIPKNTVSTDEAVFLAHGVISIRSTVSATALMCGKYAAYFQEDTPSDDLSVPYIVSDHPNASFLNEKGQVLTFLQTTLQRSNRLKAEDLSVDKTAAEKIADEIESLWKNIAPGSV